MSSARQEAADPSIGPNTVEVTSLPGVGFAGLAVAAVLYSMTLLPPCTEAHREGRTT
jgi:hypothetical protein